MIRRVFTLGKKSTSLKTSSVVFRDGDYWFELVWQEEQDRRRAKATIPPAYAEFKRLMGSIRSS